MTDIGSRASRGRARYAWLAASPLGAGALAAGAVALFIATQPALAATATAPDLGTAASFGVLAGTTVTNTGPSTIGGDLGLYPGTSVTGFPPGTVTGTQYIDDGAGVAKGAQADLTTAYNNAAGQSSTPLATASIGAGQVLAPGVYKASSGLGVSGALILDAQNDPNAVWIFQVPSALITASGSSVRFIRGGQACNVFWQVGSSATLGTGSVFQGTILALTSITVTTGDTVTGRALARNGAVTLDDDTINVPSCTTGTGGGPTGAPTSSSPTGTPTSSGPTGTPTSSGPTGTPTSSGPTGTPTSSGPTGTPTSSGPIPVPTGTGPMPVPTGTGPMPVPTGTRPASTPTSTGPASTPTSTRPVPRPTSTGPTTAPTSSASAPTPVGSTFPVTG